MSDLSGGGGFSGGQTGAAPQGGAAPSAQQAAMAALQQGNQAAPEGQPQGSDLAQGFLSRVDPAHRAIVEPYIKQWDAGVTRRFQDLHGQLSPFEELGADPETLAQALQVYQMIDNDPQQVMAILQEALGGAQQQGAPEGLPPQQQGLPPTGQPEQTPGIPPEISQKMEMFERVLESLAQNHLNTQQQQEQAQQDQQLDNYLGLLKQEYGEFDDDYVLAKMYAGMDGEEAVQAYQQKIQGQVDDRSRRPNVPRVLGGGGSVPPDQQRIAQASRKDVRGLVANILQSSNTD